MWTKLNVLIENAEKAKKKEVRERQHTATAHLTTI